MQRDNLDFGQLKHIAQSDLNLASRIPFFTLVGVAIVSTIVVFGSLYLEPETEPAKTEFAKASLRWMIWFVMLIFVVVYLSLSKIPTALQLIRFARRFNAETPFSSKILPRRMVRLFLLRTGYRFCIWLVLIVVAQFSLGFAPLPENT